MNTKKQIPECNLNQRAIEGIERIINNYSEDIALRFDHSCELIAEQIEALESRLSARLTSVEKKINPNTAQGDRRVSA